jgi:hypothetical protein
MVQIVRRMRIAASETPAITRVLGVLSSLFFSLASGQGWPDGQPSLSKLGWVSKLSRPLRLDIQPVMYVIVVCVSVFFGNGGCADMAKKLFLLEGFLA